MSAEHCLIVIPGLGDDVRLMKLGLIGWDRPSLKTQVQSAKWQDLNDTLDEKLARLTNLIDDYSDKGYQVSLLGISAGGSLALNGYSLRKYKVNSIAIISGRMREGSINPSLNKAAGKYTAFKESVRLAERIEARFTPKDRIRFITTRGLYDGIVPPSTTVIEGATNIQLPTVGHMVSIFGAITLFRQPIINFLL